MVSNDIFNFVVCKVKTTKATFENQAMQLLRSAEVKV